jgi:hypothetical protein
MRASTGGFYTIDGRTLLAVSAEPSGSGAANAWKDRQFDLWAETSSLMHTERRLSAEELGLWGAIERELDRARRALNGLEDAARADENRNPGACAPETASCSCD